MFNFPTIHSFYKHLFRIYHELGNNAGVIIVKIFLIPPLFTPPTSSGPLPIHVGLIQDHKWEREEHRHPLEGQRRIL